MFCLLEIPLIVRFKIRPVFFVLLLVVRRGRREVAISCQGREPGYLSPAWERSMPCLREVHKEYGP